MHNKYPTKAKKEMDRKKNTTTTRKEKEKKKCRGQHSHGYSHLQQWGRLSKRNVHPSNLRKRHFSSTVELREDRIPACLHTHSSFGGKAAQSSELRIHGGKM